MSKEPELIADTVVDPKKWEEALALLEQCQTIADYSHDCGEDIYCEDCETLRVARDFLRENV